MSVKSKGQKTGLKPHFSTPHSNTCPEPPSYRGKVLVCLGVGWGWGALWRATPRPAWMVDGGLESSSPPDCPPCRTFLWRVKARLRLALHSLPVRHETSGL